jgi:uncharacterized NAD(P)/FAD-binding protein YdhS
MAPQRTIVIVGAGLSGTLVATNLLRTQHWVATQILLVERAGKMARGKAYADRDYPYLLNVPAGRMSAHPTSPLDFLAFAQQRIPGATAEDFLPRALYGQYLEATLLDAEVSAAPHVQFDRLRGDVCAIEGDSSGYRLKLKGGHTLTADDVVLALGNPAPTELPGTAGLQNYVADPWAEPVQFRPGEKVLLIGNGLTMADVTLSAFNQSSGQIEIHAISRHGLVPPSQTQFSHLPCTGDNASLLRAASFSALTLFRAVRELAAETERCGGDWREAVTYIRNLAPALWQRLPAREKRRMLRHIRPYWDVHRHRLPKETLTKLTHFRERQKLRVQAGRLLKFENINGQVHVTWRARGAEETQTLLVDRVVNCTGPDHNVRRSTDPLMQSLVARGLVSPDANNLGIRTADYGAVIDQHGTPATNLFYVGPLLRADHWEATAAHELRGHAERLASYLAAPVGRLQAVS